MNFFWAAGHSWKIFSEKFKEHYVYENSAKTVNWQLKIDVEEKLFQSCSHNFAT